MAKIQESVYEDFETEGAGEAQHRMTADAQTEKGKKQKVEKKRFVVYLMPETAKAVRQYALDHERSNSDVVEAVLSQYLAALDPETMAKD